MITTEDKEAIRHESLSVDVSLDVAAILDWLRNNKTPADVFGEKETIEHVRHYHDAEEVFGRTALEEWAKANGYAKAGGNAS